MSGCQSVREKNNYFIQITSDFNLMTKTSFIEKFNF